MPASPSSPQQNGSLGTDLHDMGVENGKLARGLIFRLVSFEPSASDQVALIAESMATTWSWRQCLTTAVTIDLTTMTRWTLLPRCGPGPGINALLKA